MDNDPKNHFYFLADPESSDMLVTKKWTEGSIHFNVIISNSIYDNMDHMKISANYHLMDLKISTSNFLLKLFHRSLSNHKWVLIFEFYVGYTIRNNKCEKSVEIPYTRIFQHCPISKLCLIEIKGLDVFRRNSDKPESLTSEYNFFKKQWDDRLFTDFVFHVKNFKFPVHKNILAYQSDEFKHMFDIKHKKAVITDISPEAFKDFLEYLYIRSCPNFNDHTIDLYKAAHKYSIGELKSLCKNIIIQNITRKNAVEMLEFGNDYEIDEIRELAFNIIQNDLFPEKELPQNLQHHTELIKEMVATKFAYERLLSNMITQASNKD